MPGSQDGQSLRRNDVALVALEMAVLEPATNYRDLHRFVHGLRNLSMKSPWFLPDLRPRVRDGETRHIPRPGPVPAS
jgi:hypothetical protein